MLAKLAGEDLVHHDPKTGSIVVAYPFSARPTAHRVRFEDGGEAFAMCAIDALGIAPMFGEPIEITSRDPLTDEEIRVELEPTGAAAGSPMTPSSFVARAATARRVRAAVPC